MYRLADLAGAMDDRGKWLSARIEDLCIYIHIYIYNRNPAIHLEYSKLFLLQFEIE